MEVTPLGASTAVDMPSSGVSWPAIIAGAVATATLSLVLVSFGTGTGIGLSSISPWAGSGVSATTFKIGSGIYLVVVAVMASSIGGYLAARLRTKWTGLHTNEVYFRDTAHGLLAWALATLLSAGVLGAITTHLVSGGSTNAPNSNETVSHNDSCTAALRAASAAALASLMTPLTRFSASG